MLDIKMNAMNTENSLIEMGYIIETYGLSKDDINRPNRKNILDGEECGEHDRDNKMR